MPYEFDEGYLFKDEITNNSKINKLRKISLLLNSGYYSYALSIDPQSLLNNSLLTEADSVFFINHKQVEAVKYIVERAKNTRVVIINEDHFRPQHRVFAERLILELNKIGYNYLAVEALKYDLDINKRKYPIRESGSVYIQDPSYAQLLRTSLRLGMTLFPYEDTVTSGFDITKKIEITDMVAKSNQRDSTQASNIYNFIQSNPSDKLIIYCGFGHLLQIPYKYPFDSTIIEFRMAYLLKLLSGIDPLTINQTTMTESCCKKNDNLYIDLASVNFPSIFIDLSGNSFIEKENSGKYDIEVFHPRTKYIYGRPHWLFSETGRKQVFLNKNQTNVSFPSLVSAYFKGENHPSAIPADVVEIDSSSNVGNIALALLPGEYVIHIREKNGNITKFDIKVKK
jgi:hypothetical protein